MDQHFHIFDDDKPLILLQLLACQQYIYIYIYDCSPYQM